MEENVPRWGGRSSKPAGVATRSLVGSTPSLFRHPTRGTMAAGTRACSRRGVVLLALAMLPGCAGMQHDGMPDGAAPGAMCPTR
jgi:hypothetical protein